MDRHTVFRGQDYSHTFVFPTGYILPPVNEIRMEIREGSILKTTSLGSIQLSGLRVTFTYTSEELLTTPELCDQYLVLGERYVLGGQLYNTFDYGDPSGGESQIVIVEGSETVVEIPGSEVFEAQLNEVKTDVADLNTKVAKKLDHFAVDTYAELQQFISDPEVGPCDITVWVDETYGFMSRKFTYTGNHPILGAKLIEFVTYVM